MKTAWYDKHILPEAMKQANFKPLEYSEHFFSLSNCFQKVEDSKTLLDLGCGTAEVSRVFKYDYTGADLPHIIENVSKIKNLSNKYIKFDIEKDDMSFVGEYDIVLMNSFISEIPNWYKALTKILINAKKYIILHRQSVTNKESHLISYITYGNLQTTNSIINYDDLIKMFNFSGFELIYEESSFNSDNTKKSFVFVKLQG